MSEGCSVRLIEPAVASFKDGREAASHGMWKLAKEMDPSPKTSRNEHIPAGILIFPHFGPHGL